MLRYKEKRWDSKRMLDSGGMPSSHSATVSALAVAIGLQEGSGSSSFAIAVVLACIVCSLLTLLVTSHGHFLQLSYGLISAMSMICLNLLGAHRILLIFLFNLLMYLFHWLLWFLFLFEFLVLVESSSFPKRTCCIHVSCHLWTMQV